MFQENRVERELVGSGQNLALPKPLVPINFFSATCVSSVTADTAMKRAVNDSMEHKLAFVVLD